MQTRTLEKDKVFPIAIAASFIAMSSSLRLVKHVIVGPIQLVNFPAVFTILGGLMLGHAFGFFIGFMSFLVSDFFIGFAGPWTIATSLSMGLVGALSPLLRKVNNDDSLLGLGVSSYLLLLTYDILSSVFLLIPTLPIDVAFFSAIVGLFLPSSIVFYPVGLVTEIATVLLIMLIYPKIKTAWGRVRL